MDLEKNPYSAPDSNLNQQPVVQGVELASYGQRFLAALIDGLLLMVIVLPIWFMFAFSSVMAGKEPSTAVTMGMGLLSMVAYIVLNFHFLNKSGQTIGKKAMGIRVVELDNNKPSVQTLIVKRYLPTALVSMVPVVGWIFSLVDILFIFREDRRCVHDLIAGTKVVQGNHPG